MATNVKVAGVECHEAVIDGIDNLVCNWYTRDADTDELIIVQQATAEGEAFLTTLDDATTAANVIFV